MLGKHCGFIAIAYLILANRLSRQFPWVLCPSFCPVEFLLDTSVPRVLSISLDKNIFRCQSDATPLMQAPLVFKLTIVLRLGSVFRSLNSFVFVATWYVFSLDRSLDRKLFRERGRRGF